MAKHGHLEIKGVKKVLDALSWMEFFMMLALMKARHIEVELDEDPYAIPSDARNK